MPALELGGMTLGLREGVMILIALVAVYMAFVIWRMRRLRKPSSTNAESTAPLVVSDQLPPHVAEIDEKWAQASEEIAGGALRSGLEQELDQLRNEVDAMRGELAALRDDMLHELAHLRASQTVSPIYGDAMQMAASGYDPLAIAERCGIARAEAELVVALAKSQDR
ncbi:MAG: DUF2802 domain-containing protein [Betaproteobacteria bacterium]|nr:DUF2802 domain-containing protein [Betaproteobacteria bacterium]